MKNFYIVTNEQKDRDYILTNQIKEKLKQLGAVIFEEQTADIECVISIGGDGTLIQAVRELSWLDVAFVGVNRGTTGFLTEIEPDSVDTMLPRLVKDDFVIENRMMLKATLENGEEKLALNDVVLSKAGAMTVAEYKIHVNGSPLTTYRADGVLVSTPTGSTGYNLSAGGPIVEPNSKVMTLTPICAHTLNCRSVILNGEDEICISPIWNPMKGQVAVAFDGECYKTLEEGETIRVTAAKEQTKIIRLGQESFVTVLSRKLN